MKAKFNLRRLLMAGAILALAPVAARAQTSGGTDPGTVITSASTLVTAAIAVALTIVTWQVGVRIVRKLVK